MNRGPLVALQRRKFRLLIKWKTTVKASASFRLLPPMRFPHAVIFRAFEDAVQLMRLAAADAPLDQGRQFLAAVRDDADLSPDQYMDIFLGGREVLADFLASDAKLVAHYTVEARNRVRHDLDHAIRHLVDREMREYFLRRGRTCAEPRPAPAPAGSAVRVDFRAQHRLDALPAGGDLPADSSSPVEPRRRGAGVRQVALR